MYSKIVEREQLRILSKAIMQGRTDYERSALPLLSSKNPRSLFCKEVK